MKKKNLHKGEKLMLFSFMKKELTAWMMLIPFVLLLFFLVWKPNIQGFIWSFFEMKGYEPTEFCGLKNYEIVIRNTNFVKTLWNTVQYVFWSLIIGYALPVLMAVFVNELRRASGALKFVYYLPAMVPTVAVSMLWYYIYYGGEGGLLNMLLGFLGMDSVAWLDNPSTTILMIVISMTWRGFGATMLVYIASLQGIDRSLYEAAAMDGAGFWQRVRYVTIPGISGILLLNFVRQIIGVFQVVEQPLTMTGGGPNNASMSLGLLAYNYAFKNFQIGPSLAVNVIMFLILIALTFVYHAIDKKYGDNV